MVAGSAEKVVQDVRCRRELVCYVGGNRKCRWRVNLVAEGRERERGIR